MNYFIDKRINLTHWHRLRGPNARAIRRDLMNSGLLFAEANQFAMFAVYGFHGPTEKQTLNMTNKMRIGVLSLPNTGHRKDPPAWNRQ